MKDLIRFKEFVLMNEEIQATSRKGIEHLDKFSPLKFLELLKNFKLNKSIVVREKIDGSGLRFGIIDGEFFCETSYSGPFKPGEYTKIIKSKFGYDPTDWSIEFDNLSYYLSKQSQILNILKEYQPLKVIAEVLYNPLAKDELEELVKFVHIYYDKSKLGSIATLIPIAVIDDSGDRHRFEKIIIQKLTSLSNSELKIISNVLNTDLEFEVDDYLSLLNGFDNIEYFLKSRKQSDLSTKNTILEIINKIKDDLRDKVLKQSYNLLGNDSEGYVLEFPNQNINLKITTDTFKNQMKKDKENEA
jgi:hypothetical protein